MKHIVIFREPFFSMVLSGEKTIESRWSMKKIAPFCKVKIGDELLLKQTNHDVTAIAKVKDVKYFELTPLIAGEIRAKWSKEIGIDKFENWETYKNKRYCTLIWLEDVSKIERLKVERSHGCGWIVLKD